MIGNRNCHVILIPQEGLMIPNRSFASLIGALLICLSLCPSAFAQVTGGTISGTATDPTQAAVPGAEVTILNQATGVTRKLTTNQQGVYSAPNLLPGNYTVTVSATGFASAVHRNLVLEVGQEVVADIHLQTGEVTEAVEIQDEAPRVALASSTLSNVVGGKTVRDLPINGRDWTLLAALEPGVHTIEAQSPITTSGNARANRGFGTQLTIGGNRPQQNNYRLDGISINDYSGGGPGNVIGSALGVDAVQEFSVLTGNAPADYGRTSGGVINAVTRSGQNQFHGTAYEFLRNSALDAANFFEHANGLQKAPFKRHQFGGSIGGPIRKERTFFFFDYEGLRQDLGTPSVITVPSRAARTGQLTSGKVTIDPKVVPFLAVFPLPNGPETGDFGTFAFTSQAVTTENLYTGRIDHKFSDHDSINGIFLADPSKSQAPDSYNFALIGQEASRKLVSIEETHLFSPRLLNIARIGYSRSVVSAPITLGAINPLATDASLGFLPGSPAGNITITGITAFTGGIGAVGETDYHYGSYQTYDDLLYTRGNHSLKFGAALEQIQSNEFAGGDQIGRFTFGSLRNFLTNVPTTFNAVVPGKNETIYLRQTIFGAYVQDDFRVRPNLTLNLGLRYEMATVPTEKYDRLTNLVNLTSNQPQLGSPYFQNPTWRNFSPRLGFAWDPFKDGKTALRGGFGIYDTLPLTYQYVLLVVNANPFSQAGSVTSPTLTAGSFPLGAYPKLTSNTLRYSYVEPNPKRSYVEQWNLNLQRQLPFSLVAQVGYIGEHGVHQPWRTNDANIVIPTVNASGQLVWPTPRASGTQLNPNVGVINALAWQASNTYHGLNVGVTRQSKGLRLGLSYTFSKSLDNSSASIAGGTFTTDIQAPFLFYPQLFRGRSSFDVNQNLSFNYLWEIPTPRFAQDNLLKMPLGGWQLGGIFRAATGLPFTVTVGGDSLGLRNANPFNFPDRLITPECANPVNPGNPDHYIKTECFIAPSPGTRLGNSGRNQYAGPGIRNFDLSLIKSNQINERFNVQFRTELFNLLNHPNFSVPDRTSAQLFNQSLAAVATAGRLNSTSTTSRQIQFALKLSF